MDWTPAHVSEEVRKSVSDLVGNRITEAMKVADKTERNAMIGVIHTEVRTALEETYPDEGQAIKELLGLHEYHAMRSQILDKGVRADGRGVDDIRPITAEVSVLPRTHGSALFTRGQTQALGVATLGTQADEQRIDSVNVKAEGLRADEEGG